MNMTVDALAARIRSLLPPGVHSTEKRMFGGLAFMTAGNMLLALAKDGSLLVRVGKAGMEDALAVPGASIMDMGGRSMSGFVVLSGNAIEDDDDLRAWIARALAFVATLPAK